MSDGNNDKQWRDARFKKALEMAPDAAERPSAAVRETILMKARATAAEAAAAAAPPPAPKRRGWSLGLPWNSALATVAVVGFVSVLWWHEELPKQAQEASEVATPAPAVSASAAADASREQQAELMSRERAAQSQKAQPAPKLPAKQAGEVSVPVSIAPTQPPAAIVVPQVVIKAPPPSAYAAPAPAARANAASPPGAVFVPAPEVQIPGALPAPAPAPAPAPVSAAPLALAPAPAPPPPAPVAESRFERITVTGSRIEGATAWTALRVQTSAGPVLVPSAALPASGQILLQQQLRELQAPKELRYKAADTASDAQPLATPVVVHVLKVDVLLEDGSVVHLTLGPGELRQQIEAALAAQGDKATDKAR